MWISLMRKCYVSCHGRITYFLCASTLPLHFTYIVEDCLSLSECSVPSTPWLQSQLPSLAIPWGTYSSNSGTFCLGGGQWQSWYLLFKVVWWCERCWEDSAMLCDCIGCLCPVPSPTSSVRPLVPSVAPASCPPSEVPVGAEQKGDACRQCSLLSSIAR